MTFADAVTPTEVITWMFFVTNTGRVLAYLPQIRAAWVCTNGASSVSRLTWGCFALAHLCGSVYGAVVVGDPGMAAIFAGNCLACSVLLGVITWKRRRHRSAACHGHQPGWHPPTQWRREG